jgi:hypothetical protein
MVGSETNFGEPGFDPESAEASFLPQRIKDVGSSSFDPELGEQTFMPTRIKNVGLSSFDSEAALMGVMPGEVVVEIGGTALDVET